MIEFWLILLIECKEKLKVKWKQKFLFSQWKIIKDKNYKNHPGDNPSANSPMKILSMLKLQSENSIDNSEN